MLTTVSDHRTATWLRIALWLVAAAVFGLIARGTERDTAVEVISDGSRLRVVAADSELTAPVAIETVDSISIQATDSIFPPGARFFEIKSPDRDLTVIPLPRSFDLPSGEITPVGDWEIDDRAGAGDVFTQSVSLGRSFDLRAVFTGRSHQHLTITMEGIPTVSVSLRSGLINNDLFIWDAQWNPIAVTSIDPRPWPDFLAAVSLLSTSAAAAAALIAIFLLAARLTPQTGDLQEWVAKPPNWAIFGIISILVAAATLTSLWFAADVLQRLPHLPDSVIYLVQADWLREGRLTEEVSAIQAHLDLPFTYVIDDRWIAHYPVGWPALLATGLGLGAPWMVAPILGGLYVILLWVLGRQLYGEGIGLIAAVLAVLSPIARIIFGSHLSHAASAVFILLYLVLLEKSRRTGRFGVAVGAGVVLGLTVGIRPLDALAIAFASGLLLLDDFRRPSFRLNAPRILPSILAGGVVGILPALLQNLATTGNPLSFPYSLARGSMYGLENVPYGLRNLDAILASTLPALHGWGWGFSRGWVFLALPLAFACVPFLLKRASRTDLFLAGCFVSLMVVHIGTKAHGLHGFGPRYYVGGFALLFLLTARGFRELAGIVPTPRYLTTSLAAVLFAFLTISASLFLPQRLQLYAGYNHVDGRMEQAIQELGVDQGLILFADDDWRDWAMASRLMTGSVRGNFVFARSLEDNSVLWKAYPDLPVFRWQDGQLEPLDRTGE